MNPTHWICHCGAINELAVSDQLAARENLHDTRWDCERGHDVKPRHGLQLVNLVPQGTSDMLSKDFPCCEATDGPEDHIYGTCELPKGHPGRHQEMRDGKLWASWSGDSREGYRASYPS
jgi:hypothetical protein